MQSPDVEDRRPLEDPDASMNPLLNQRGGDDVLASDTAAPSSDPGQGWYTSMTLGLALGVAPDSPTPLQFILMFYILHNYIGAGSPPLVRTSAVLRDRPAGLSLSESSIPSREETRADAHRSSPEALLPTITFCGKQGLSFMDAERPRVPGSDSGRLGVVDISLKAMVALSGVAGQHLRKIGTHVVGFEGRLRGTTVHTLALVYVTYSHFVQRIWKDSATDSESDIAPSLNAATARHAAQARSSTATCGLPSSDLPHAVHGAAASVPSIRTQTLRRWRPQLRGVALPHLLGTAGGQSCDLASGLLARSPVAAACWVPVIAPEWFPALCRWMLGRSILTRELLCVGATNDTNGHWVPKDVAVAVSQLSAVIAMVPEGSAPELAVPAQSWAYRQARLTRDARVRPGGLCARKPRAVLDLPRIRIGLCTSVLPAYSGFKLQPLE
ncbi:hypothetical protein C8T65DRAFT_702701 [Cerioporus squamosus]|nr:hypothetical protein C8T65DRAFT_702701 [Cerioporus squamosus]